MKWAIIGLLISVSTGLEAQSVRVQAMRLMNDTTTQLSLSPPILLTYKQNYIAIRFADTAAESTPHYAYRLNHVDFGWVNCGTRNEAIYSNLYGGNYTFQVKNLRSQQPPTELMFSIEPAFWQRWWFIPLLLAQAILVIGIALYLLYLYRIRQFLRLQQTRDRIARDLHDDMGSYLSSISILSRSAALNTTRDPDRAQQSIERIGQTARQVMGAMSDIVWSINPDHDSMEKVVARMRDVANELFADSGTTISLEADPTVLSLSLPLEKRHDFFLIFKEALTNTARYAEATQVRVRLQREGATLLLIIQDNGRGFDVASPRASSGGGNGLKNMHKRAENMGGTLHINSVAGQGTTVKLVV